MSTPIPGTFNLLAGYGGQQFAVREPINALATGGGLGMGVAVLNGRRVYAEACRRVLYQFGHVGDSGVGAHLRRPMVTVSGSYATIFEIPVTMSIDAETVKFIGRGDSIDVEVNLHTGTTIGTPFLTLNSLISGTEATLSASGTLSGDVLGTLEIRIKTSGGSPGKLYGLQVYEDILATGDLPS